MVPASVERTLSSPGQPLAPALRRDMESRFRADFAQVRVHADGEAARSAREVSALAYTVGPHIAFDQGRFAPETASGRELLAHELAHVVQQAGSAQPALMRKGFESTVEVCKRVRESRRFEIENGGLRVVLAAEPADSSVPGCSDFPFSVSLARSKDWWPDKEIGTCKSQSGGIRVFQFANIPRGSYYLSFWRMFDHPHCCLRGDLMVFDEAQPGDGGGCKKARELSTMEIVHAALDLAGFVPVLGVVADGVNAGIYVVEGDWANVGLSAVAALPLVGDGIKAATMGGKAVIKVEARTAVKLGEEGLAKELKGLKAASERSAAVKIEKEAAEQAARVEKTMAASTARGGGGVADAVRDARAAGLIGPGGRGGTVDLGVHTHNTASAARRTLGVSGADVQSMHILPTSMARDLPNYSRGKALTTLGEKSIHQSMDSFWQRWGREQRKAGRTTCTGAELEQVMLDSIEQMSGFTQREKNTMAWLLNREMVELGITAKSSIRLPGPK